MNLKKEKKKIIIETKKRKKTSERNGGGIQVELERQSAARVRGSSAMTRALHPSYKHHAYIRS